MNDFNNDNFNIKLITIYEFFIINSSVEHLSFKENDEEEENGIVEPENLEKYISDIKNMNISSKISFLAAEKVIQSLECKSFLEMLSCCNLEDSIFYDADFCSY
eukprot:snap_masked-scaffold_10-processed-gene-12.45-mRNA-1 protein AED:1.00 eAED:1.00 QI:0/0/0/0/1/1/2/0/103